MKFNSAANAASVRNKKGATRNFEGGVAFELEARERLYTKAVTSLIGENKFYQSGKEHDQGIINDIQFVAQTDPEFILKLAAYARNEMYLRSASVMLLVEASMISECKPYIRKWASQIIRRADEPAEVVGYWISRNKEKAMFPNSLKKGIADALERFDEYQFEKYNRDASVKLRDVLRICHPKPKDEKQDAIYKYIIDGTINQTLMPKTAIKNRFVRLDDFNNEAKEMVKNGSITWEVAIAKFGNKKEVWEALDLPFMAMLRNLRNMVQSGADLKSAIEKLTDRNAVKRSKQFPFRFFSAYRELEKTENTEDLLAALSQSIEYSVDNLPMLQGTTLIACDNSESMESKLSSRGNVTYMDIANLFGALASDFCEKPIVGAFGTDWARVTLNPRDSIFSKMNKIEIADTKGWATNGWRVIEQMIANQNFVDRVILLSDMQCYDHSWQTDRGVAEYVTKYRSKINPNLIVYSVDLAGYGTVQLPSDDPKLAKIAGWSDKIFQFIPAFESEKATVITAIENYGGGA